MKHIMQMLLTIVIGCSLVCFAEAGEKGETIKTRIGDLSFTHDFVIYEGGALPATFVYDAEGRLRAFWEGKATYAQMQERVVPILEEANL